MGVKNCLDVFSWVILWRLIYELIFSWNPHLKEIALLHKLATAEVIIVDKNINAEFKQEQKSIQEQNQVTESNISVGIKSFMSR